MTGLTIDIEAQIENLRALKGDLEEYYWAIPAVVGVPEDRREQVAFAIRQIGDRAAALEDVMRAKGARQLQVARASADETRRIMDAVVRLGGEIPSGAPFGSLLAAIRTILQAADDVGLAAARGQVRDTERPPAAAERCAVGSRDPRRFSVVRDGG